MNKLPIIHELLTASVEENDAHIFRFIADPPTTTMQRLKGLTTGSLPTFIDAGDNFASSATAEDNWVKLARDHGLISVMLGDDTWLSLYPEHFKREFGYNPFDVKDLHTVDNGILKDLYSELRKRDWNILLAHFEGVDHVGHRFGPDHPEMASKLSQMDGVLRKVVNMLDNSTLLFVMGDHGMTPNGDHGGDSTQEMNAVLFAYSKQRRLWSQAQTKSVRDVAQIDLVPTISLLMGLPIPFSNLGSIIPELFFYGNNPQQTLLQALHLNAHQLSRYLDTYNSISGDLPLVEFHELKAEFEISERVFQSVISDTSSADSRSLQDQYLGYFQGAKAMCRSVWAKFDLVSMTLGILALFSSTVPVLFLLILSNRESPSKLQWSATMWLSVLIGALCGSISGIPLHFFLARKPSEPLTIFSCFGSALGSVIGFVYCQYQCLSLTSYISIFSKPSLDWLPSLDNMFATLILLTQCIGLLSNSFVLYEDGCISFLLVSLYIIYFSSKASRSIIFTSKGSKTTTKATNWKYIVILCLSAMMAGVCCRTGTYFQDCVEQKVGCERSSFLLPLSAAEPFIGSLKSSRYILSCSCVALVPATLWLFFKQQGLLENFSPFHLCVSYGMPAMVVCVSVYWALQSLPAVTLDSLPDWQHVAIPRIIYVITGIIILVLLFRPMVVRARVSGFLLHLRAESNSQTVELTGWKYVYVSPCLLLWVVVWLVLTLLQGDGLAPAMLLFAMQAALTVAMFSVFTPHNREKAQSKHFSCSLDLCLHSRNFSVTACVLYIQE
jgi:phosphatidylinositol glycan class O